MTAFKLKTDPLVREKFKTYPSEVRMRMEKLRELILDTAKEIEGLAELEETLKWGEPSYLAKKGSTLRMDWKEKNPGKYALYFKCTSKLVPYFRKRFGSLFTYENNRAILFNLDDAIPETELRECIKMTLTYHEIKKHLII